MKSSLKISMLLILALNIFSCKEKTAETTEEVAAVAEPIGTKFVTDATMAKLMWAGSKPTGTHSGSISVKEGSLYVNDGMITAGSFIIDMNSINVLDLEGKEKASLEEHLKGTGSEGASDFFNVSVHPTAKFEIIEIIGTSEQPNSNSTVSGNLTMLGVTKAISFATNIGIGEANITINSNPFTINRTDWGIKYGSKTFFDNLADKFIDDNITLQLSMSAVLYTAK